MKKLLLTVLWLCYLLGMKVYALDPKDLLAPDEAFKFSAQAIAPDRIKLEWQIADGYFLYRNQFRFKTETPDLSIKDNEISFPKGKIKTDPNLGELETYHNNIVLELPLERGAQSQQALKFTLQARYQGCVDAGVCLPPTQKTIDLDLAAVTNGLTNPSVVPTASETPTPAISRITKQSDNKTLDVGQAFKFSLVALDRKTLIAHWDIEDQHHLYKSKISFKVQSPNTVKLGTPIYPEAKQVDDEFFGRMEVYDSDLDVSIPLELASAEATQAPIIITTEYQGCSEKTGICYPPVLQDTQVDLSGLPEQANTAQLIKAPMALAVSNTNDNTAVASSAITSQSSADDYYNRLQSTGLFGTIALFSGLGLLLAFTPCIFPMIPILSGVIIGQSNLSARKAFLLSLAYVLASASAYAIIGIFFGIFGKNLQAILQHPVAIGSFAALFVFLALSMFGFYELQLPNSLQSRLNELSNRQRSGSLLGAAIMGFLSTLIVGPCVAPPLAGALTYIAQTKDALLGGSALFSMGFAMGLPLLIVGTSAGHLLPRAGAWMDTTKAIFGILMLGLAIWMLNRIVPFAVTMALTGTLLVSSGIHMGALDRLDGEAQGWRRFWKSIGLVLLFFGTMQLVGVAVGSKNMLQPLQGIVLGNSISAAPNVASPTKLSFQRVKSLAELDQALAQAQQNKQLAILDFYADWCTDCKRMEKSTLISPLVTQHLTGIKLLKADVTEQNKDDEALQKKYAVVGPPTMLFFDQNSREIKSLRLIGYEAEAGFAERLQKLPAR